MISRELLQEVLGVGIVSVGDDLVKITSRDAESLCIKFISENEEYWQNYNIYQLANKVKEWAIGLGYTLTSSLHSNGSMCLAHEHNAEFEDYSYKTLSGTKFEPETIFMVCELILENRS